MKLITINSVKLDKEYLEPGTTLDVTDKTTVKYLLESGAAAPLEAQKRKLKPVAVDKEKSISALMTIKAVDENTATVLYNAGLQSINDVSEQSVSDLKKIKGISDILAKEIYNCFEG